MRIGILEDEALIAEHLSAVIEDKGYELVFLCDNVEDAKVALTKGVDLVLLDIKVNGALTGLDLAQHLNENYHLPFIFISSNFDINTLEQVKIVKPYGFLTKPFKNIDVDIAIDVALEKHNSLKESNSITNNYLFVKDKGVWIKLLYEEIMYIEAADNYSTIFFKDKGELVITKNLKYFEEHLPQKKFIRINRSVIVKTKMIHKLSAKTILIDNKEFVLSDNINKKLLKEYLNIP